MPKSNSVSGVGILSFIIINKVNWTEWSEGTHLPTPIHPLYLTIIILVNKKSCEAKGDGTLFALLLLLRLLHLRSVRIRTLQKGRNAHAARGAIWLQLTRRKEVSARGWRTRDALSWEDNGRLGFPFGAVTTSELSEVKWGQLTLTLRPFNLIKTKDGLSNSAQLGKMWGSGTDGNGSGRVIGNWEGEWWDKLWTRCRFGMDVTV